MCIGTDGLTPYAPSTYSILSCFARTPIEALLLSKRRYAKQLILFFPFRFLLCRANLTPCLAPGVYFLDPALLQPSPSYLHPCRPQWMIHLERLPSSIRKLCNYTLQPSLHFSDLTMLCNAWKTLAFLYLFLSFFSTLSLLLFLWVTFSIDCLCFLMLWRGPGACGWGKSALLDTLTPP